MTIAHGQTKRKKTIDHQTHQKRGWSNCVDFIDGASLRLFFKPRRNDSGDCISRRCGYTLSVLIICNHNLRMRHFDTGWPGSTHDDRAQRNSEIFKNRDKHFSLMERMLGDSACTNKNFLCSACKKPPRGALSAEHALFNKKMKPAHTCAEHCIGLLKNRFQFLKSLQFIL